jgi:hypothetical protein
VLFLGREQKPERRIYIVLLNSLALQIRITEGYLSFDFAFFCDLYQNFPVLGIRDL